MLSKNNKKKKREKIKENDEQLKNQKEFKRVNRKHNNKHSKKEVLEEKKRFPRLKKFIFIFILICILFFGVYLGVSTFRWKSIVTDMAVNENSVVKDLDGNTIATLGGDRIKKKVSFSDIPDNLKNAYVSIEDERFYSHHGVDIKRTGHAVLSYIFHMGSSSFGGSTITQQLVKNLTGDTDSTISRKITEWGKAFTLETFLSKDEILELYFNIIYTGPNIYGVEAASQHYFSKSVSDLSLEECAFLAGINNSPNSYYPFGEKDNSEKINKRIKLVLGKMKELGYINDEQYDTSISKTDEGLKFKKKNLESEDNIYSYHTDAMISQLISDISERKNISTTFATNYINMSGLNIFSTQNTEIQNQMEKEFEKSKYKLKSKTGGDSSQAAMVIIDHKTGNVIGCTGGLGKKTISRGLNRATQSIRQTGSSIKPLAVLIPGIDKKIITGATILLDEQRVFADGYNPENYSNDLGEITVRVATESSQNIPFVEIMEKITPKVSMKYLENMGITSLTEKDENLALALGGLDKGISPLQMAGAYATIANDGVYIEPTFYKSVTNKAGSVILEPKQKRKKVCSKEVSYIVKELLTQPVKGAHGTATYCAIPSIEVAAKTGTTDENYDRWLCGFTPYYTAVSWYGYDQNETILYNGKKNPAGILWANIMGTIHKGLKSANFNKPSTITQSTICSKTGLRANSGCSDTYEEYFLSGTIPEKCLLHNEGEKQNNLNNKNQTNNKPNDLFDTTTKEDLDIKYNETNNNKTNQTTNNTKSDNTNENNQTDDSKNNMTNQTTSTIPNNNSVNNNTVNTNTNTNKTNSTSNTNKETNNISE